MGAGAPPREGLRDTQGERAGGGEHLRAGPLPPLEFIELCLKILTATIVLSPPTPSSRSCSLPGAPAAPLGLPHPL